MNNAGHPYEQLDEYGEVIFLTQGAINRKQLNATIKKMGNLLEQATENDYLCISGNNFLCAIATVIWGQRLPRCAFLNWNPVKKNYEEHNMMLGSYSETK